MVCPACGRENDADARFCASCGASLAAPAAEARKVVTVLFADVAGLDGARRAARPRARCGSVMWRYFEAVQGVARAARRDGREVHRRRGHGRLRRAGRARGRRRSAPSAPRPRSATRSRAERRARASTASRSSRARRQHRRGDRRRRRAGDQKLATGDAVNVAARLEQAAAPGEVLLGAATYAAVRGRGRRRAGRRPSTRRARASRSSPTGSSALRPDVPGLHQADRDAVRRAARRARPAPCRVRRARSRTRSATLATSSARPGSASRGSRASCSTSLAARRAVVVGRCAVLRRGQHRTSRSPTSCATSRATTRAELRSSGRRRARRDRGALSAARRHVGARRLARGDRLGVPAAASRRSPRDRPLVAGRRRHALGRAGAARPRRVRRRLLERRADPRALHARPDLFDVRPGLGGAGRRRDVVTARAARDEDSRRARRGRSATRARRRAPRRDRRDAPRATRCSSSSCSRSFEHDPDADSRPADDPGAARCARRPARPGGARRRPARPVEGRLFHRGASPSCSSGEDERRRHPARPHAQGVHPAGPLAVPRRRRLPLQPRAHPRRRVRVAAEGAALAAARAPRRLARGAQRPPRRPREIIGFHLEQAYAPGRRAGASRAAARPPRRRAARAGGPGRTRSRRARAGGGARTARERAPGRGARAAGSAPAAARARATGKRRARRGRRRPRTRRSSSHRRSETRRTSCARPSSGGTWRTCSGRRVPTRCA